MSVTWIDTPGPLANTSEPLDFTTSGYVTSISIEFNHLLGNGVRETVYDGTSSDGTAGGDFSYAYRASTKGDGHTWHIVRQGRWPAEFRIRISEAGVGGSMITARYNLVTGSNTDVVTTPEVGQCNALTYTVVSGSVFSGLAAPVDQSQPHYVRLINDSGFTLTLKHEDAANAQATSRFHFYDGVDHATSSHVALDAVWIPASMSATGTARWFFFNQG